MLGLASGVEICKKGQKNLRTKLVDYCPKQNGHRQGTLKQRNKQNVSKPTNHKPCPLNSFKETSVFLRGPLKMIDGAEKP